MAKRLRLTTPMAVVTAVEEVAAVDLEADLLVVGAAAEDSVEDAEEEVMDLTEVSEVAEEVAEAVTEEVDVEASEVVIERVAVEVVVLVAAVEVVEAVAAVATTVTKMATLLENVLRGVMTVATTTVIRQNNKIF